MKKPKDEGGYPALRSLKDEYEDIPPDCKGLYILKGYCAEEEGLSRTTYRKEKLRQEALEDAQNEKG